MLFSKLQFKWHYHCGNVHAFLKYLTNNEREKKIQKKKKYEFSTTKTEKNCKNSLEGSENIVALKTAQHDHLRKEHAHTNTKGEKEHRRWAREESVPKVFEIKNKNKKMNLHTHSTPKC